LKIKGLTAVMVGAGSKQTGGFASRLEGRSLSAGFAGLKYHMLLMALVFAVIFGLGAAVAFISPKSYTANASLLMQLGANYVFDPAGSDGSRAAIASIDEVVQSEVEILNAAELKRRIVEKVGLKTLFPDDSKFWNPVTETERAQAMAAGVKALGVDFATGTVPGSNVVRLSFKHKNAETAAFVLNTWLEVYQAYRREVFRDRLGPALEVQKQNFDARLTQADTALQDFLDRNNLVDFDTAHQAYIKLYDQSVSDRFAADEAIAQNNARLRSLNARLASLSPEISVQRDLDLSVPGRILALKQQRQELLSRYQPDAQPVTDVDTQIGALEGMIASGAGVGEKEHRMGVNPVYQEILTQKLNAESELAALSGRRSQLAAQGAEVARKLKEMMSLQAEYNGLSSEREAVQKNLGAFVNRKLANEAATAIATGADEGVRVVDAARPPEKPQSLRRPLLILSFLIALVTAVCAGLLRALTRPGVISAQVTSEALGLPILAQARVKA
jgi:uncharacterized protein involved in exopolysaccharide biosynthesis